MKLRCWKTEKLTVNHWKHWAKYTRILTGKPNASSKENGEEIKKGREKDRDRLFLDCPLVHNQAYHLAIKPFCSIV